MKVVDVLGDDCGDCAPSDQLRDGVVTAIGFCIQQAVTVLEPLSPGLLPDLVRRHEVLELYRPDLRPQSTWTAKIGYPRLGAYTGPGEHHRPTAMRQQ